MVALPFWKMTVIHWIPLTTIVLDETSSIGLNIKKKRLELKLRQEDVAQILHTTDDSVRFWETGRTQPQMQVVPRIIKFLGYNPFKVETKTLAGRVKNYRLLNGLNHEKMAKLLGVDPATVSTWETGKFKPDWQNLNRLNEMLSKQPQELF